MRRTIFESEHSDFRESVRRFFAEEVVPHHDAVGARGHRAARALRQGGEVGMLAMAVPEEHGGLGLADFRFNQVIVEEAAYAGVGAAGLGITLHNDICLPYLLEHCDPSRPPAGCPGWPTARRSPRSR
jgi:alkylation response protein AidB-like acyl-CoA dehydrogenase